MRDCVIGKNIFKKCIVFIDNNYENLEVFDENNENNSFINVCKVGQSLRIDDKTFGRFITHKSPSLMYLFNRMNTYLKNHFDWLSGVNVDKLEKLSVLLSNNNRIPIVYIFDWDRTITKVEGLFGTNYTKESNNITLEEYMDFVGSKLEVNGLDCPSALDMLILMCGGHDRFKKLKKFISNIPNPVHNFHICTRNNCTEIIRGFTRLFFENINKEELDFITSKNVNTVKYKMNYISETIIEPSYSYSKGEKFYLGEDNFLNKFNEEFIKPEYKLL